ncbi:MAG: translation elongation factor Ts [Bacteroidota bacterium]|nr:translation elongation factor Ts [Bacteroidota bacterium]
MAKISAKDVAKLRKMTGAGMMDCKNVLTEAEGDFDKAIDLLRKKGQKVAGKRAGRDATEGAMIAKVSDDAKNGVVIALNCETDFVAKNEDFVKFAHQIADIALENLPKDIDELKALKMGDVTVGEEVINQTGVIGEKLDLSQYGLISDESVAAYIHMGNKIATLAGFNKPVDAESSSEVVMQIAAMNPIAIDKDDVSQEVIDKELEIGKELAIKEGKPEDLAGKIAQGRLGKFFKLNTLLNQEYVKDKKKTVKDFLKGIDKDLTVTKFYRFALDN